MGNEIITFNYNIMGNRYRATQGDIASTKFTTGAILAIDIKKGFAGDPSAVTTVLTHLDNPHGMCRSAP